MELEKKDRERLARTLAIVAVIFVFGRYRSRRRRRRSPPTSSVLVPPKPHHRRWSGEREEPHGGTIIGVAGALNQTTSSFFLCTNQTTIAYH